MAITTYTQARTYLESLIKPVVFVADDSSFTPLDRMRKLLELLGNPHEQFASVVVTGTSGKGSTAYLLSHLLTGSGYRVGLTISPHLQKLNERMQIGGVQISDVDLIALVNELPVVIARMQATKYGEPSYFEVLMALAFLYFARSKVDLAVVEVGFEGKYDGSNVLSPLGVVVTNVSLDHTQILGNTTYQIAKGVVSAIRKSSTGGFVVTGVSQPSILKLLEERCMEAQKKLFVLEKDFSYTIGQTSTAGSLFDFVCDNFSLEHISLSLIGRYQVSNASLALAAVGQLSQFGYSFSIKQLLQSLHSAFFPGRFEMVSYLDEKHSQTFQVILDGAHNGAKMRAFIDSLEILYPKLRKIFIVGFKRDKQIDVMLRRIFSVADSVVFTQFSMTSDTLRYASSTASDLLSLSEQIPHPACPVMVSFSVKEALAQAVRMIDPQNCLLVVTGSLYLVGETREFLRPTYP